MIFGDANIIENRNLCHVKYVIEIDRDGCIACATCYTMDPKHYESTSEGKSKVVGGTANGKSVGEIDDDKIEEARAAEAACPVCVIKVTANS